jgi:hypothetical protein
MALWPGLLENDLACIYMTSLALPFVACARKILTLRAVDPYRIFVASPAQRVFLHYFCSLSEDHHHHRRSDSNPFLDNCGKFFDITASYILSLRCSLLLSVLVLPACRLRPLVTFLRVPAAAEVVVRPYQRPFWHWPVQDMCTTKWKA